MLCQNPCACHAKSTWNLTKVLRAPGVLTLLTSKSLSRHSRVQILRPSTSKSCPNLSVFIYRFWRHLGQLVLRTRPFLGADFPSQRSHKTMEKHRFRAIRTCQNLFISHISAVSHLRDHISLLTDLGRQLSV